MLAILLLLSAPTGDGSRIPESRCPVAEEIAAGLSPREERFLAACKAGETLRAAGWSDSWIAGALANAWHESGWNPSAVGDRGNSVGFWQLNERGLGKGMGDLRLDVRSATSAVIGSATRQRMNPVGDDPEEAARQFCIRIMRPSNSRQKGDVRARTVRKLQRMGHLSTPNE